MSYIFFSDTFPPRPDGVAHSVAWSCQALRDRHKEVVLVRPDTTDRESGASDITLPSRRAFGRDYHVSWTSYFRSCSRILRASGISIDDIEAIHVHSLGPIGLLGLRCAWMTSSPLVLSWHTDLISYASVYPEIYLGAHLALLHVIRYRRGGDHPLHDLSVSGVARTILRSVDAVVAPSMKTASQLRTLCPDVTLSIVPTGLPTDMHRRTDMDVPLLRSKLGIGPEERVLLFVGRLSAEKNPQLLVSTFREIRLRSSNVRCVAVGNPGPGSQGRAWRREFGRNGIVTLPSMSHSELLALYRASDLLLVTSLTETQGLTALEACAVGLPVLCVDPSVASFGEATLREVNIVAAATPAEIAAATIRTLDSPGGANKYAEDIARRWLERSSATQADRLIDLYDHLQRRRKPHVVKRSDNLHCGFECSLT